MTVNVSDNFSSKSCQDAGVNNGRKTGKGLTPKEPQKIFFNCI